MAKVNFRQQKRQRELARKERQSERLLRRGEKPPEEVAATLTGEAPRLPEQATPPEQPKLPGGES
jgi:hypothetical protein